VLLGKGKCRLTRGEAETQNVTEINVAKDGHLLQQNLFRAITALRVSQKSVAKGRPQKVQNPSIERLKILTPENDLDVKATAWEGLGDETL